MKVVIVYHKADLDGHCSGAVIKRYYQDKDWGIMMIGHDYHMDHDLLMDVIKSYDPSIVVMADLSLPESYMMKLNSDYGFIWIDHHQQEWECIPGIRKIGTSACELAYEYFFQDRTISETVRLIGIYDTWRKEDRDWDNALNYQYGMRNIDTDPTDYDTLIKHIFHGSSDQVYAVITAGKQILQFQKKQLERIANNYYHIESLMGYSNVLCLNTSISGSLSLESVFDPEIHDFMLVYRYHGGEDKWVFSGYHTNPKKYHINLGLVFKKEAGGGGHAGAAGFTAKELPWKLKIQ